MGKFKFLFIKKIRGHLIFTAICALANCPLALLAQSSSRVEATLSGATSVAPTGSEAAKGVKPSGNASGVGSVQYGNQSMVEMNEATEQVLKQRAKKRTYPGGSDEESIKVQAQLPVVTRKMGPTQEIEAPEPSHQDAD